MENKRRRGNDEKDNFSGFWVDLFGFIIQAFKFL
jgi:hypothetical protein